MGDLPDVHDAASGLVTQHLGQGSLLTRVKVSQQGLTVANHVKVVLH